MEKLRGVGRGEEGGGGVFCFADPKCLWFHLVVIKKRKKMQFTMSIFCRIFTCSHCSTVFVIIESICTTGPCKVVLLSYTDKIKYLHAWNALLSSVDFFLSKINSFFSKILRNTITCRVSKTHLLFGSNISEYKHIST